MRSRDPKESHLGEFEIAHVERGHCVEGKASRWSNRIHTVAIRREIQFIEAVCTGYRPVVVVAVVSV